MRVIVCFQLKKSKARLDGKCPLYLRCTMNGQWFEISTGFFLDSDDWIETAQQAKGKSEDVKVINNRLDPTGSLVNDFLYQLKKASYDDENKKKKENIPHIKRGKGLIR